MNSNEELLLTGNMQVQGRLVDASNATLVVEISLGAESTQAIYKPIAGERPLWDFQDGNLASRERAAFLISEALNFHLVPMTILRDGPFGEGMVQQWIEINEEIDLELFFRERNEVLRKVVIFDAIINNTDRKIGHLLPLTQEHIYVCDHGVTFHEEDKLRTVLWQWAGEDFTDMEISILRTLRTSLDDDRSQELSSLITEFEYDALLSRLDRLITEKTFPLPNPDWPAVPWPPY
ncbi:unannotated protein [freshwater metagenome]|uniref:Unannotated protein n=1 Tax=freshwater metagenome TaxID=449393 RepID=A0A6J7F934_9ZZZZ|nr:SCO1664 family protein [Actinomycetota bacterium]